MKEYFEMKTLKAISAVIIGLCFLLSVTWSLRSNAGSSSYYLNPPRVDLVVSAKNHLASGTLTITSSADKTIRLKATPKLWTLDENGAFDFSEPPANGFNLLKQIRFNPDEFDLKPRESKTIRYVVKIPQDQPDGEYTFQVYFYPVQTLQPQTSNGTKSSKAGITPNIDVVPVFGSTVYVYKGNTEPDVKVNRFSCQTGPSNTLLDLNLNMTNQGSKHARLTGNMELNKLEGSNKKTLVSTVFLRNKNLLIVFPKKSYDYSEKLNLILDDKTKKQLPSGQYEFNLQLVDQRDEQPAVPSRCQFEVK